jgi:hypothetical protein
VLRIVLTEAQREKLDTYVLSLIRDGRQRQKDIEPLVRVELGRHLPLREDFHRYVDGAIGRLKRAKEIVPVGGSHFGWRIASKRR